MSKKRKKHKKKSYIGYSDGVDEIFYWEGDLLRLVTSIITRSKGFATPKKVRITLQEL